MMKWRRLHRVNRRLWEHNVYLQSENLRLRRELAERDGTTMPVIPPDRSRPQPSRSVDPGSTERRPPR